MLGNTISDGKVTKQRTHDIMKEVTVELDQAHELLGRIDAMINAPYWNSERREKVGTCARKAKEHIDKANQLLKGPNKNPGPFLPGL